MKPMMEQIYEIYRMQNPVFDRQETQREKKYGKEYGERNIILPVEALKSYEITEVYVTGYYDRKTKKFQSLQAHVEEGFSYETTPEFDSKQINVDFSDVLQDIEYIKIQLKDSQNNALYEVRASGNNYVELFYENRPATLKLDKIPIYVRLPSLQII